MDKTDYDRHPNMKKSAPILVLMLIIGLYSAIESLNERSTPTEPAPSTTTTNVFSLPESITLPADEEWMSGQGEIIKILPDDTKGSKHQKFILRVSHSQTLLFAHNIDLAPRVDPIHEGDIISFRGQYETNSRGGVIHWTHHDPKGRHEGGWLKSNGDTFK